VQRANQVLEPLRNRTLSKTGAVEAASKHFGGGGGGTVRAPFLKKTAQSQTTHEKLMGLLDLSLQACSAWLGVNRLTLGSILSKRPPLA
jgi:hypothetical protein